MADRGKEFASYIQAQIQAEQARRSSVTARGGTALTSATGLVTLILAVFAVILGKDFRLTGSAKIFLAVAVLALLVGALCAVVVASPFWKAGYVEIRSLRRVTSSLWTTPEHEARKITADANIDMLETLMSATNKQVNVLTAAGFFQIIAVAALAVATWITVIG